MNERGGHLTTCSRPYHKVQVVPRVSDDEEVAVGVVGQAPAVRQGLTLVLVHFSAQH